MVLDATQCVDGWIEKKKKKVKDGFGYVFRDNRNHPGFLRKTRMRATGCLF